jgi:hypothetical protein
MRVAEFSEQGKGLLAVDQGLVVVVKQGVTPCDVAQGVSLPALVEGTVPRQGLLGAAERSVVAALELEPPDEGAKRIGQPALVAELTEQVQRLPQVGARLVVTAKQPVADPEGLMHVGFAPPVGSIVHSV